MNRLIDRRAVLSSSSWCRSRMRSTCRTLLTGDERLLNSSKVRPMRVLSPETTAELQDVANHLREHRNFELVSDRTLEENDDDPDSTCHSTDRMAGLGTEPSFEHMVSYLKSYLHACINANMMDKAHSTFIWYRYKLLKTTEVSVSVLDSSVYNVLLKAWANSGKVNKVKELFRLMALAEVSPDMHSYSFLLLALARQPQCEGTHVQEVVNEMKEKGLRLERLFVRTTLSSEQRKAIQKLVLKIFPALKFMPGPPIDRSELALLKDYRGLNFPERLGASLKVSDLKQWCCDQISAEKRGYTKIGRVYMEKEVSDSTDVRNIWDKHETEWRKVLKERIAGNLLILKNRHMELQGINVYPYLASVDTNDLTDIVIQHLTSLDCISEHHSPPSAELYRILGSRVESKYMAVAAIRSGYFSDKEKVFQHFLQDLLLPQKCNSRHLVLRRCRQLSIALNSDQREMVWPQSVVAAVGRFLYDIILNDLKINANALNRKDSVKPVPLIFSFYKADKSKVREEVRPHPVFSRLQKSVCGADLIFDTNELPMLCPPFPWISPNTGGYLIARTSFIREFQRLSVKRTPTKNFVAVMDAMNNLQLQPWIVNQPVLDVMISVFRANGDEKLDIPIHQSAMRPIPKRDPSLPSAEKHELMKLITRSRREKAEMFSLWCDCLYKLSIANFLRDRIFWLPHNLDFRGRVYSVPPHLQHLGGDLSRGLLKFAVGKPLGTAGMQWLKLHLVNLTGSMKRASVEERIAFAEQMMSEIMDSADNPLDGRRWWTQCDDAWQALACCKEIAAASRSPDPEYFVSHFPVHQDGSCNGLQHYAALGRDQHGAESVNLVPFDRPQDVYTQVAQLVEKERQKDAENGVAVAQSLEGFVSRKVVKRTVMTFVYGVTRYGARLQVLKELKNIENFPRESEWLASAYIMFQIFASIERMFTATREIQDWMTECATLLSKTLAQPVQWVTPLAFPVTQPYFKQSPDSGSEVRQHLRPVSLSPNSRKQKNGFPPNFIHSLDSTHMMLTALACESQRLSFVSVHDCYWTHATDVDAMNRVCRQEFVKLHSQPILSDLSDNFVRQYATQLSALASQSPESYKRLMHVLSSVPKQGSLRLDQVLDSVYFFS